MARDTGKIVTNHDWMIGALIALNQPNKDLKSEKDNKEAAKTIIENSKDSQSNNIKEEESKIDLVPQTQDSTNVVSKQEVAEVVKPDQDPKSEPQVPKVETEGSRNQNEDSLIQALKTLQNPHIIDPLVKHDFDSFIVESF